MSNSGGRHHVLSLRVEYGSWEHTLYWGCQVDFEALELCMTGQSANGVEQRFKLTLEQARSFFKDAEKLKVGHAAMDNLRFDFSPPAFFTDL